MAFGSQEVAGKTLKLFLDSQTGAMKIFTVTTKGFPSGREGIGELEDSGEKLVNTVFLLRQ